MTVVWCVAYVIGIVGCVVLLKSLLFDDEMASVVTLAILWPLTVPTIGLLTIAARVTPDGVLEVDW